MRILKAEIHVIFLKMCKGVKILFIPFWGYSPLLAGNLTALLQNNAQTELEFELLVSPGLCLCIWAVFYFILFFLRTNFSFIYFLIVCMFLCYWFLFIFSTFLQNLFIWKSESERTFIHWLIPQMPEIGGVGVGQNQEAGTPCGSLTCGRDPCIGAIICYFLHELIGSWIGSRSRLQSQELQHGMWTSNGDVIHWAITLASLCRFFRDHFILLKMWHWTIRKNSVILSASPKTIRHEYLGFACHSLDLRFLWLSGWLWIAMVNLLDAS